MQHEERTSIDAQISFVEKRGKDSFEVTSDIRVIAIFLSNEDPVCCSMPDTRPALVCPAEAERKIRFTGSQYLGKRSLKQPSPIKPVVPIAKALDTVLPCEQALLLTRLGDPEVVIAQLAGDVWLLVTWE